jgi:hypothetical protein
MLPGAVRLSSLVIRQAVTRELLLEAREIHIRVPGGRADLHEVLRKQRPVAWATIILDLDAPRPRTSSKASR